MQLAVGKQTTRTALEDGAEPSSQVNSEQKLF